MTQNKKFIAPGAWFSMRYPATWNEFEDSEGCFLFYNPDEWTGNFRISAYRGDSSSYGQTCVRQELKDNSSAAKVSVGGLSCAYSKEMFEEEGAWYVNHFWVTGIDDVAFECSFTVAKGASMDEALEIIASLELRREGTKYAAELITVRLSEIYRINEAYEWATRTVKERLAKDFQGSEEDIASLQRLVDEGVIGGKKRDAWLALGIVLCVILTNEVDGLEWCTLIDGNREDPVLQCVATGRMIDPMKLVWSKVKAGEKCDLAASYQTLLDEL